MKINHKHADVTLRKHWKDISIGTVFYATIHGNRFLLLRTFDQLVDLADPNRSWSVNFEVDDYFPVEAEVTVLRVAK